MDQAVARERHVVGVGGLKAEGVRAGGPKEKCVLHPAIAVMAVGVIGRDDLPGSDTVRVDHQVQVATAGSPRSDGHNAKVLGGESDRHRATLVRCVSRIDIRAIAGLDNKDARRI
jgi:hypothetical protein